MVNKNIGIWLIDIHSNEFIYINDRKSIEHMTGLIRRCTQLHFIVKQIILKKVLSILYWCSKYLIIVLYHDSRHTMSWINNTRRVQIQMQLDSEYTLIFWLYNIQYYHNEDHCYFSHTLSEHSLFPRMNPNIYRPNTNCGILLLNMLLIQHTRILL